MAFQQDILRISSPVARDIVVRLYRLALASGANPDDPEYLHSGVRKLFPHAKLISYREWLRSRLKESEIVDCLIDGEDRLSGLADALPSFYQPLHRLFQPRNLAGRLELLLRNLEWFLDPAKPPVTPVSAYVTGLTSSAGYWLMTALGMSIPQLGLKSSVIQSTVQWLSFVVMLVFVTVISSFVCGNPFLAGISKNDGRYQINAVELYQHVLERLSDAPEPAARLPSDAHSGELSASDILDNSIERAKARIS